MGEIKPVAWIVYSDDGDGRTDADAVLGTDRPSYCEASEPLYTAEALATARDAALEEASKVCATLKGFRLNECEHFASAVRALKNPHK